MQQRLTVCLLLWTALAGLALGGCLTRGGFERDRAQLACAIHDVCKRRQCDALRVSPRPLDRHLYELTCPAQSAGCEAPDYGDWADDEPPRSDCFEFDSQLARQCLAELEAVLQASESAPLTDELWCWRGAPSCSEVYAGIEWPRCPLEE